MALEWLQGWINSRGSMAVCERKKKKKTTKTLKKPTLEHAAQALVTSAESLCWIRVPNLAAEPSVSLQIEKSSMKLYCIISLMNLSNF